MKQYSELRTWAEQRTSGSCGKLSLRKILDTKKGSSRSLTPLILIFKTSVYGFKATNKKKNTQPISNKTKATLPYLRFKSGVRLITIEPPKHNTAKIINAIMIY